MLRNDKLKFGTQKRKELRVIRERLQSKGQQRLKSFSIVGSESERKRSCENASDQETANEELNVSESSLGKYIKVSLYKLGISSE